MAAYLLLRDNKQSGPYTLGEIVDLGFKPYDLVWVEGKSAAWRYPGEVAELKPHAPQVEEQPFDRFFRKEDASSEKANQKEQINNTYSNPVNEATTILPVEQTERKIFVSFPGSGTSKKTTPPARERAQPLISASRQPAVNRESDYSAYQPADSSHKEEPVELEERYSQPLDQIKEMYVQTLNDRKKRLARKRTLTSLVRKSAVPAMLIAGGIGIGFLLNGFGVFGGDNSSRIASGGNSRHAASEQPRFIEQTLPAEFTEGADARVKEGQFIEGSDNSFNTYTGNDRVAGSIPPEKRKAKNNSVNQDPDSDNLPVVSTPEDISTDPQQDGVRRSAKRDEEISKTPETSSPSSNSLKNQVAVSHNEYKRGTFGGIFDLKLTVSNQTGRALEEVLVELSYLKPAGEALKKERIIFSSIPAGSSVTQKIEPFNRGVNIEYRILKVIPDQSANATVSQ